MLKQTVSFKDFNDNEAAETLYFNLTRIEVLELEDLQPRLEAFTKTINGEERDLTPAEVKEFLDIVKLLIEKSYGVRSEDGKRFMKSPELFTDFKQTAVYDEFLMSLFTDIDHAWAFIQGILPQAVLDNIPQESRAPLKVAELPAPVPTENVPAWIAEDRDPTEAEIRGMTPQQLQDAFRKRMNKGKAEAPTAE